MNKKAFILCSAGVLSLGLLVATNAGVSSSKGIIKADDAHSGHGKAKLMEIGFDWKDPTKVGYKPYWRCPDCCNSNPAASRYDYEDKATVRIESELTLAALAGANISGSTDGIKDIDTTKASNIDQTTACYVTDNSKTVAYFSRSRKLASNGDYIDGQFDNNPSTFGFTHTGDDAITCVTFSYRYKSWNYTLSKGTSNSYASCKFAYTKDNAATETSYSLDNKIFNDDTWHEVTITAKEVNGGASFSSLTGLTFEFADLRGYFMISGLTYNTEATSNTINEVSFGSVDSSGGANDIASCSIDTSNVGVYADENCTTSVTATKLSDVTEKKIYVKVPLTFTDVLTNTSGEATGRQAQDNAIGRLTMNVLLNEELRNKTSVKASLKGYKSGTWAYTNLRGDFINSESTSYGANGYSSTMDAAINANAIYALVTLDFSGCTSDYALGHIVNAFSVTANWSAYLSTMTKFSSDLSKVGYVRGDKNGWLNDNWGDRAYYQMVPDVDCTDCSDAVVWVYKLSGFTKLKVFYENAYKGCRYTVVSGDYNDEKMDADANSLVSTDKYNVRYYDYGTFSRNNKTYKNGDSFYVAAA